MYELFYSNALKISFEWNDSFIRIKYKIHSKHIYLIEKSIYFWIQEYILLYPKSIYIRIVKVYTFLTGADIFMIKGILMPTESSGIYGVTVDI